MSILGQCPKCGHRVLHVNVEQVVGVVDGDSKARCLCYSCIHCHAVLGVPSWMTASTVPEATMTAMA